jgi:hypothetical protein
MNAALRKAAGLPRESPRAAARKATGRRRTPAA